MKTYVLDASVVAAAFFQEEHEGASRKVLTSGHSLIAPDLIHTEVANVIWKRHIRGEIDAGEAGRLLADVLALPLQLTPCGDLIESALELALRMGRSVYDCLYLALALQTDSVMITADRRLVNSLAKTPLAKHIAWIGDTR
jgi:predicted nucleic acid-binding protein